VTNLHARKRQRGDAKRGIDRLRNKNAEKRRRRRAKSRKSSTSGSS